MRRVINPSRRTWVRVCRLGHGGQPHDGGDSLKEARADFPLTLSGPLGHVVSMSAVERLGCDVPAQAGRGRAVPNDRMGA